MKPGKSLINSILHSTVKSIRISVMNSTKFDVRYSIRHQFLDCPTLRSIFRNLIEIIL